jgi:predicted ArsR family transcriptional regulator
MAGNSEGAADRILFLLKTKGPQDAATLAQFLQVTPTAVRQHMVPLGEAGLVAHEIQAGAVGRPKRRWALTKEGHARFPDTHAFITTSLLADMRDEFGESGVDAVIKRHEKRQLKIYKERLEKKTSLSAAAKSLADERSREGYMAELEKDGDGFLLTEHHCPICAAATECQGFCRSELSVFQKLLKPYADVERAEHLLSGDARCVYRITPKK